MNTKKEKGKFKEDNDVDGAFVFNKVWRWEEMFQINKGNEWSFLLWNDRTTVVSTIDNKNEHVVSAKVNEKNDK